MDFGVGHHMTVKVDLNVVTVTCECGWYASAPCRVGRELKVVRDMVFSHGVRDDLLSRLSVLIGPRDRKTSAAK